MYPFLELPGGLPSMGSHRVGNDWSDLAAAAASNSQTSFSLSLYEASMSGVSLMNKEVSDHAGTQEVCVLEPRLHSIMLDPGSQTSSLPNVRNKFLLFISHLVCRILWQQPEQTKTLIPITRHSGKDRTWATVKGWVIAGSLQGAGRVK